MLNKKFNNLEKLQDYYILLFKRKSEDEQHLSPSIDKLMNKDLFDEYLKYSKILCYNNKFELKVAINNKKLLKKQLKLQEKHNRKEYYLRRKENKKRFKIEFKKNKYHILEQIKSNKKQYKFDLKNKRKERLKQNIQKFILIFKLIFRKNKKVKKN